MTAVTMPLRPETLAAVVLLVSTEDCPTFETWFADRDLPQVRAESLDVGKSVP